MANTTPKPVIKRKVIFRLSSLGDVVLATAAIAPAAGAGASLDWVVSREFAGLLEGHPDLSRVWAFDRKSGLRGWVGLCRELWNENYDEILDLHQTLRTRLARLLFFYWDVRSLRLKFFARTWRVLSKQRSRAFGYFTFKKLWPAALRPTPFVERFARLAGGTGTERPDLRHLLKNDSVAGEIPSSPYLCVMPGSFWPGKRWSVMKYLECVSQYGGITVVLGTKADRESEALVHMLGESGRPFVSGVGRWDLAQVANILAGSEGYLGNDTGLAHLAEAVGTRAVMVFGPTIGDMGFGPWREESVEVGSDLWCRPCGKDGRSCFRLWNRHACLTRLGSEAAIAALKKNGTQTHVPGKRALTE